MTKDALLTNDSIHFESLSITFDFIEKHTYLNVSLSLAFGTSVDSGFPISDVNNSYIEVTIGMYQTMYNQSQVKITL